MSAPEQATTRIVGVAAHVDAGKTTLCERILYDARVERRMGEVEDGTTVLDWMKEERERGITITAAATSLPWREARIELVDTPGHVDFGVEVARSLLALDALVVVVDALAGVQARTESVWRAASAAGLARLVFLNKLDRPGADAAAALARVSERLDKPLVPLTWPHHEDGVLAGVVDLVDLSVARSSRRSSRLERAGDARPSDEAQVLHHELLEAAALGDEELLSDVVAGRAVERARVLAALKRRILAGEVVPLLAGSALANIGVHALLDAVVDLLPSPLERPARRARARDGTWHELALDADGPLCAQVFKLQRLGGREVAFARVHAGRLVPRMRVELAHAGGGEVVAGLFRAHGETLEPLEFAPAGTIAAVAGLSRAQTGESLCHGGAALELPGLDLPQPVVACTVEPVEERDRAPVRAALAWLVREDPTLRLSEDAATGRLLLSGMGELHLDVALRRVEEATGLRPIAGSPQVSYVESVRGAGAAQGAVDRLHGEERIAGEAKVEVEPDPAHERPVVEFAGACQFTHEARVAVQEALEAELQAGPRLGLPVTHVRVRVSGASRTDDAVGLLGAVLASREGLARALAKAGSEVREPWVRLEVRVPSTHAATLQGELMGRGVLVEEVVGDGQDRLVRGRAPLQATFGFARGLRSLSQGRADFTLWPLGHEVVDETVLRERGLV
jgi:elongation factor G